MHFLCGNIQQPNIMAHTVNEFKHMLVPSLFYAFYQEKALDLRTVIMQVRVNRAKSHLLEYYKFVPFIVVRFVI